MKEIYLITMLEKLEKNNLGWPEFGDTRPVGWYPHFEEAEESVKYNYCDIRENVYDYCVIEQIFKGLYGNSIFRRFYKFNKIKEEYEEIEEPKFLNLFTNISIG